MALAMLARLLLNRMLTAPGGLHDFRAPYSIQVCTVADSRSRRYSGRMSQDPTPATKADLDALEFRLLGAPRRWKPTHFESSANGPSGSIRASGLPKSW